MTKFLLQLEKMGIKSSKVHRNISVQDLLDLATQKNEGIITSTGSLSVKTGKYTGRSPDDRYIIGNDEIRQNVDWSKINRSFPEEKFEKIFQKMKKHLEKKRNLCF